MSKINIPCVTPIKLIYVYTYIGHEEPSGYGVGLQRPPKTHKGACGVPARKISGSESPVVGR